MLTHHPTRLIPSPPLSSQQQHIFSVDNACFLHPLSETLSLCTRLHLQQTTSIFVNLLSLGMREVAGKWGSLGLGRIFDVVGRYGYLHCARVFFTESTYPSLLPFTFAASLKGTNLGRGCTLQVAVARGSHACALHNADSSSLSSAGGPSSIPLSLQFT